MGTSPPIGVPIHAETYIYPPPLPATKVTYPLPHKSEELQLSTVSKRYSNYLLVFFVISHK